MRERLRGTRLARLVVLVCALAAVAAAASVSGAAAPTKTEQAITLTVLDGGGVLGFMKPLFEDFQKANPGLVNEIKFEPAPSPQVVPKIQVQQTAGQVSTDIVVAGLDVLGFGIVEGVWQKLVPNQQKSLPNMRRFTPRALQLQKLGEGQGVTLDVEILGPLLNWDPARVQLPGRVTPQQLLAWAKEHPGRFTYARPPSSGPGRQFLMVLPYALGDKNPLDPVKGWAKTWRFLKQLKSYTAPNPASTGESLRSLASGNYDLVVSAVGWDLGMRASGAHPVSYRVSRFGAQTKKGVVNATWLIGGHYAMIPRGISGARLNTVLRLINFLLSPSQQWKMYIPQKKRIPVAAVKGVKIDNVPAEIRAEFQRTERRFLLKIAGKVKTATELDAETLAVALDRWEREIGR